MSFRFIFLALALAGRLPWLAFFSLRWGLAMTRYFLIYDPVERFNGKSASSPSLDGRRFLTQIDVFPKLPFSCQGAKRPGGVLQEDCKGVFFVAELARVWTT